MKKEFCKTMSYVLTAAMLMGITVPSSMVEAKKKSTKAERQEA